MLEKDYIMRLVREFGEAVALLLNKSVRKQQEEIQHMYNGYVGPYEFYHTAALEDVMDSFGQFPEDERLPRMEMLARLYYVEADLKTGPMRMMLLDKALALFMFVDRHDKTYDMDRIAKISDLKQRLG